MNIQTSTIFLQASREQSRVGKILNTIHNSMKIHEILKDKSDKRCEKFIHWKLQNTAKKKENQEIRYLNKRNSGK